MKTGSSHHGGIETRRMAFSESSFRADASSPRGFADVPFHHMCTRRHSQRREFRNGFSPCLGVSVVS